MYWFVNLLAPGNLGQRIARHQTSCESDWLGFNRSYQENVLDTPLGGSIITESE